MKTYIFITANINKMGGAQHYTASKASYLKNSGWNVKILNIGSTNWVPAIPFLRDYTGGNFLEIRAYPTDFSHEEYTSIFEKFKNHIDYDGNGEMIIESYGDKHAYWGELLAEEYQCKHYCFICNEYFRGDNRFYEGFLDFFDFKHKRKELAGITEHSLPVLFDGYKEVPPEERYVFVAAMGAVVQDVYHEKVEEIEKRDWNIAYVGRNDKGYVKPILKDIKSFSFAHPDKQIQFIVVGKNDPIEEELADMRRECSNLQIISLGNLTPIPLVLYSKIDVVIAGAGSAIFSCRDGGALTLIADARNFKANGVLGYDTKNLLFAENTEIQNSFYYYLEKIFVDDFYEGKSLERPERISSEECYSRHFEMINESCQEKIYFTMEKFKKCYEAAIESGVLG